MKINSIKTKTIDTSGFEQLSGPSSSGSSSASGVEGEILARLDQMDAFEKEYGEYLSDEKRALFEELKLTLNATLTAIRTNGLGGAGGASGSTAGDIWDWPQGLDTGWNGIPEENIKQNEGDAAKVASTAEGAEYMGTIIPPNSGDPLKPTVYGFQMGEDMSEAYLTSSGKDLILTVIYENGDKKSWLIKDGSVRKEPLVISALGLKGPVVIDCKKAYLAEGSLYIHGSEGDDIIFGAQSSTKIVGWDGNDTITGGANNDQIWGDEHYELSGSHSKTYGGEDTINGGAGDDTIYGGGKSDTVFSTDKGESVNEHEITIEKSSTGAPSNMSWIESDEWKMQNDQTGDGTVVYRNEGDGKGGTINLDMPEGYTMAFGDIDASSNSLVITFVNEAGESFKIKFEGFFSGQFMGETADDRIVRLNFTGTDGNDIISFDRIPAKNVTSQIINISGGSGDDIILGVKNQLWADGLNVNNLEKSNLMGAGNINGIVNGNEGGIFAGNDGDDPKQHNGYKAEGKGDHIWITKGEGEQTGTININAPEGFEYGYKGQDDQGTVIILVDPQDEGPAKTLVIKVDGQMDATEVFVQSSVSTTGENGIVDTTSGNIWSLTEISLRAEDYRIDGGNGSDLVVAPAYGSKTDSNGSNETILIGYDGTVGSNPPAGTNNVPGEGDEDDEGGDE